MQVEDYVKDPLVWHGGVKARWAVKMYDACMKIQAECEHKANYPFLLQHGSKDAICDIKGSDLFFERSKSQSKVYKVSRLMTVMIFQPFLRNMQQSVCLQSGSSNFQE